MRTDNAILEEILQLLKDKLIGETTHRKPPAMADLIRDSQRSKEQQLFYLHDPRMSVRALNVLGRAGVETLEELSRCTVEGLSGFHLCGEKTLWEIVAFAKAHGHELPAN